MNNSIKITDLFGINILSRKDINDDINKDYIIINFSGDYIDDLLLPINQYNGNYIYKLNKKSQYFDKLLIKNQFNIDDYIELGNYIIYNTNNIQIMLIRKKCAGITNVYNLIDVVGNLYVWKPVYKYVSYTNFGVVITTDEIEPTEPIGTIKSEYVKLSTPININSDMLFENEYSILGSHKNNKRKILSIKMLNNTHNNRDNNRENKENYIEHFANSCSYEQQSDEQYEQDGQDGQNGQPGQDAQPGQEYGDYALDEDMENIRANLNVYKGKRLVLVESDNPWYINKENVIELKYINNQNYFGARDKYLEGATFKSNTVYDTTSPNLGYGYSYADRKNPIIEKFTEKNTDNDNKNADYIILIMISCIILLLVYNYYKNKKNKFAN